jgi:hypothetical protein
MYFRDYKLIAAFILVSTFLFNVCCKGVDPFGTPQETMRTFIKAYNEDDKILLRKCGQVDDLLKKLTFEEEHAGLVRYSPVKDVKLNIIACDFLRPDLTKRFTTDKAVVTCEFTSATDNKFYLKDNISVAKKRHSFQDFSETSRWQIMVTVEQEEQEEEY